VSRTTESLMTPAEARARVLALAEPEGPTEVSLGDALGLVLAEAAVADVDLPPFDRAAREGFAVRSAEASPGALLRIATTHGLRLAADPRVEAGEAVRVAAGDALPVGANAVVRARDVRHDPETGPARVIELTHGVEAGRGVTFRGSILAAGATVLPAGTRLRAPMIGLLAAQGCVQPVCHRRVRVAILAVGDHLVGPGEEPVMHRERNATGAALVALALQGGAMPFDLQAVPETRLRPALDRATNAPVIVLLGRPSPAVARALKAVGFDPVVSGLAVGPGGRTRYGVIRDDDGQVAHHVFLLPLAPIAAATAFVLLVQPLIARLQGGPAAGPPAVVAAWDGTHRATGGRSRAIPATFTTDAGARGHARPVPLRGPDDLPAFARADGLALLPPHSGPWEGGEVVDFVPFP